MTNIAEICDKSPFQVVECHNKTTGEFYVAVSRTGSPSFPLAWTHTDEVSTRLVGSAQTGREALRIRVDRTRTLYAKGEDVVNKRGTLIFTKAAKSYYLIPKNKWDEMMALLKSIKGAV